jgi:transcriptional regulator with PAS, ATPase and Fis domain
MREHYTGERPFGRSLADALAAFEKQMILQALAQTGNNTKHAAEQLNIPLHTLYRRMKKYHITL